MVSATFVSGRLRFKSFATLSNYFNLKKIVSWTNANFGILLYHHVPCVMNFNEKLSELITSNYAARIGVVRPQLLSFVIFQQLKYCVSKIIFSLIILFLKNTPMRAALIDSICHSIRK